MTDAFVEASEHPGRVRDYRPEGFDREGREGREKRKSPGRPTHRDKTLRAFRAYLDLLDTAQWLRDELRGQLAGFGLDLLGLRVLEMLYRKGPMEPVEVAEERECSLTIVHKLVSRMKTSGWVRCDVMRRYPAKIRITRIPIARRGKERLGRRVSVVRLTPLGRKLIGTVFPKHEKVVKALMRALDGREQETLSMLCRKLREGDSFRYLSELTHWHPGE